MKLGIYNEPSGGSIGGTEYSAVVLAEALSQSYSVEIVHHRPTFKEAAARLFGKNLNGIHWRFLPEETNPFGDSRNPWRRYQEARSWHKTLSEPYDVFINFTHHMPPFCYARYGLLWILFPMLDYRSMWPWVDPSCKSAGWNFLRRNYYNWEWKQRFNTYQVSLAISSFTRDWIKRRWGIDSNVVYPPIDSSFPTLSKTNTIISVGRFTGVDTKKQLEMVQTFRRMEQNGLRSDYYCVGGLGDDVAARFYFEDVRSAGVGSRAQIIANMDHESLKRLFAGAKIFWHAVGYNEDQSIHPERTEHFGIVTVEAMAAGCVPIVHDKGGQTEIVKHGVNGFLWHTLDELQEYTWLLTRDEDLWSRMSCAARARAQDFRSEVFVSGFVNILQALVPKEVSGNRR